LLSLTSLRPTEVLNGFTAGACCTERIDDGPMLDADAPGVRGGRQQLTQSSDPGAAEGNAIFIAELPAARTASVSLPDSARARIGQHDRFDLIRRIEVHDTARSRARTRWGRREADRFAIDERTGIGQVAGRSEAFDQPLLADVLRFERVVLRRHVRIDADA